MDVVLALLGYKLGWRRVRLGAMACALIGSLFLVLPFVFRGFTLESWREAFSNSSVALPLLVMSIGSLLLIPKFQRRMILFRAALNGSGRDLLLVVNQPMPDSTALTLPTTISLRVRWLIAFMWSAMVLLVLLLVESGTATLGSLLGIFDSSAFIFVVALLVILFILFGMIYFPLALRRTIRITEEMLSHQQSGYRDSVIWGHARVFALVEGGKRTNSAATYMLSSGKNNVRWTYCPRTRWYSMVAPTTSDEEYQRQMEALLSYVAARTGLPLLDIR